MNKQEVLELLKRYNAGDCSAEEKGLVESWYLQFERTDAEALPDEQRTADLEAIRNSLPVHQPQVRRMPALYKIAAAAAIVSIISTAAYFAFHSTGAPSGAIAAIDQVAKPGGNKAVLTLANGKQIVLTDASNGLLTTQSNIYVIKTADGKIVYQKSQPVSLSINVDYNSVQTPAGGIYSLLLSDGTEVTLDAASSIRYPVLFRGNERRVEITGQAYFKVTHDRSKPFRVACNGQTIEVLGTQFNINSYPDEGNTKTTLVEGSVKVSKGNKQAILKPGQRSVVINSSNVMTIADADEESDLAWKNGIFQFRRADVQMVMRQFSRWYNVDVRYEGKVPQTAITGKVLRSANASQIISILNALGIETKTEGRTIIIIGK